MSQRITFIIEDNASYDDDGGTAMARRVLEYTCATSNTPSGPKLIIQNVLNLGTNEPINDPNYLPDPAVVMDAARLYEWHQNNQPVFADLIVTTDAGPITPTIDEIA